MKNGSSFKSNATNSPKTPGGISKSLLTPCRRVGLSRNWRNKGPSPFISPLSGNVLEVKEENIGVRKRKERILDDNIEETPESSITDDQNEIEDDQTRDIDKTPSRNVEVPRRKKSKTLLSVINKSQEEINTVPVTTNDNSIISQSEKFDELGIKNIENVEVVSTPLRSKSKKSKKRSPALKKVEDAMVQDIKTISNQNPDACSKENTGIVENPKESTDRMYKVKERSPNDLRKECIVVIQRKIFKKTGNIEEERKCSSVKQDKNSSSQTLFDSDSDDMPLNQLNNIKIPKTEVIVEHTINKLEDSTINLETDDFVDKSTKIHVNKLKVTKSPKNKLKTSKSTKTNVDKLKVQPKPTSQSSYDDDDDFDNKKTILIRKTYDKVTKPHKAKSTGSITQKDIDELKARIEMKKKLLLAQSITPETEELRSLIKKWQKGCQEALMELLDLMKTKFHDKQNMDYSEMLETLKIPPDLVGYDSENDCFNSPDDASIILAQFKDT